MEEREVELIDYINVILKRKWMIVAGTLVCILAAAVYSYGKKAPTFYEAKASLLVTPPPFKADLTPPSFPASVYEKLARAQDLEQAVIDSLGLKHNISSLDGMLTMEVMQGGASGSSAAPASSLITFSVKSDKPDLSAQLVNVWADLFVKKNSGITRQTVAGSYDFIIAQYETTRKRLEDTEDAILRFKTNSPQIPLSNERTAVAAKFNDAQTAYINQGFDLSAREKSLKQQMDLLRAVEIDGKAVSSLVEEGRPIPFEGLTEDQKNIRKLVVDAKRDLLQAEKALLDFNIEHRVELLRAEVEKKNLTLAAHKAELVSIELSRKTTQTALEQIDRHLQQQSPVLVLSKAITDDALWQRARDGALSPDDVKKLDALKLRSEQLNPVYEDLIKRKATLQLEYDSYTPKETVLKDQLEKLKKEIPALLEQLQDEERKQATLAKKVETAHAIFNVYQENYSTSKVNVEKLRLEIQALKDNLVNTQSFMESSRSRALSLEDQLNLLQMEQARLERESGLYKSSFDRFAKLAEDARVAKAGEAADLRVVMRAVEATPLTPKESNTILLAGAVGLMASAFLAFLIEYVEKARQRAAQNGG